MSISTVESGPIGIKIVGWATSGYGSRVESDRMLMSLQRANVSNK